MTQVAETLHIQDAKIIESAASPNQFPKISYPEIAFAGKSNVGKSTLINTLLHRRNLVKTSATPGKTRLINFFEVQMLQSSLERESQTAISGFVDLPGYGYAKVPQEMQNQWKLLIEAYLEERSVLQGVVLIVDGRHNPTAQDQQIRNWLEYYERPVLVVASKMDKIKRSQMNKHLQKIKKTLDLEHLPLPHSSTHKIGQETIWQVLQEWIFGQSLQT